MSRLRSALAGLFLFPAALASVQAAGSNLPDFQFTPGSGIEMKLVSFYEEIPPAGFLPLRLEVRNRSASAHSWRIETTHGQGGGGRTMQFSTGIAIEPQSERTFDLLVPVLPEAGRSGRYSNLNIRLTGYGVTDGASNLHSSSSGGRTATPFVGMGESLSVKNWGPLRDRLEKVDSRSLDGAAISPALLPEDWRGLAGFDILILSEQEWRQLPPAPRGALQDWLAQGGMLVLCHADSAAPADLPTAGEFGAGTIAHWPLGADFVDRAEKLLAGTINSLADDAAGQYRSWPLALSVGRPALPRLFIIIFVIVFAAVIGPVNFLVFAPAGNRHRLFWTTPLISLAATVLMGVFIVLSEGFGGRGERFEVLLNLPALRKSVLWQEQMSRTGVLVSTAFTPSESSFILPIDLRPVDDTPYSYRRPGDRPSVWTLAGSTWSGDWFRSRSAQGQVLAAVLPTRAGLQVSAAGGAPVAVSSFEQELKELWYFDDAGAAWRAEAVRPGEKKTLVRAGESDFKKWLEGALKPAGAATKNRTTAFARDRSGKFFALGALPQPVATLDSIRWRDREGLILGVATP